MFIPLSDANALKHIRRQYVTIILIAVNCLIWLFMGTPAFMGREAVQAAVYSYGFIPAVVNGFQALPPDLQRIPQSLTYVTYAFFHGDFMHLAGNMLFIWVFGDNIEDAMGHLKYFLFFIACAVAGAFAHAMVDPQSAMPLIGASGAAAGIVGAYILLHPKIRVWVLALGRIPLRIPAVFVLGAWILFQFYQFASDQEGQVSWSAHIGGILAGMFLIVMFRRKGVALFDRPADVVIAVPEAVTDMVTGETSGEQTENKTSEVQEPTKAQTTPKITGGAASPWGRQRRD